jgi:hypothetical protein
MFFHYPPYAPPFGPAERPRVPPQTVAEIEQDEQERYERTQEFESHWARYERNFGYRYPEDNPDLDYETYSNPNNFENATADKEITDAELINQVIDTQRDPYAQRTALSGGEQPSVLFETIDDAESAGPRANDAYHKRNFFSNWY